MNSTSTKIASLLFGLSLLSTAACSKKEAEKTDETAATAPTAETPTAADPTDQAKAPVEAEPPVADAIDYMAGQSTGSQTEDVKGEDYRNTLKDKELGVAITCPPDKTWKCKLDSKGMWLIKDMSSNVFQLRAVPGASSAAETLDSEIAYLKSILPEVVPGDRADDAVVVAVGANPDWAKKVPRTAWVKAVDVGGKWFACHGIGGDYNFENASGDYVELCKSVTAVE